MKTIKECLDLCDDIGRVAAVEQIQLDAIKEGMTIAAECRVPFPRNCIEPLMTELFEQGLDAKTKAILAARDNKTSV